MHYAMNVSTNRWAGAQCTGQNDLPWTSDAAPTTPERRQMAALCESCPIIINCALFALGERGGFYAGVWLPWDKTTSTSLRDDRRTARAALRQRVRV